MEGMSDSFRVQEDSEDEFLMVETGSQSEDEQIEKAQEAEENVKEKVVEGEKEKVKEGEKEKVKEGEKEKEKVEEGEKEKGEKVEKEKEDSDEESENEEEEDNLSEIYQDDDETQSKHFPGNSEFVSSQYSDNTSEWDSISRAASNKSATDTAVWFLEEAGKSFVKAMAEIGDDVATDEGKSAVICEGTKLLTQLERSLRSQYKEFSKKTSQENVGSGDDDEDIGELWKIFQKETVVQAVQEFLSQPVVTKCITDFAKQGKFHLDSLRGIGANHFGDLLRALGDLVKRAPELLAAIPLTVQQFAEWCGEEEDDEQKQEKNEKKVEVVKPVEQQPQVPDATTEIVVHNHVLCDGCLDDEKVEASQKAGNRVGNYIAGIRWKSAVIEDFDLCSTCEQTGLFEEKYGPFLKITHPKKAPRQLIVVLRDDGETASSHRRARRCRRRTRCDRRPTRQEQQQVPTGIPIVPPANRQFPSAPPVAQPTEQQQEAKPVLNLCCPSKGHPLVEFSPTSAYTCDVCEGRSCIDTIMYGCRACDWDICKTCACAQNFVVEKKQEIQPKPAQQSQPQQHRNPPAPAVARNQRPQAKFISDISLSDGSLVERNSPIVKTWRIQNSGQTKWPEGVRLVCVGGERMEGTMNGVVVPALEPSMMYDIGVHLVAPDRPGRYVGYWRLMTPEPNQHRFGHRLWVDVSVKEDEDSKVAPAEVPQQQQQQQQKETDILAKWAKELQTLAEMGFFDCDKNVEILEQESGNVEKVIQILLQQ